MDVAQIVKDITPKVIANNADLIEQISATYNFKVEGAGTWWLDLTKPGGAIEDGEKEADCDIETDAESFIDMALGKLNTQMAFLAGKFRTNNPQLAVRLNALIEGIVQHVVDNNLS